MLIDRRAKCLHVQDVATRPHHWHTARYDRSMGSGRGLRHANEYINENGWKRLSYPCINNTLEKYEGIEKSPISYTY